MTYEKEIDRSHPMLADDDDKIVFKSYEMALELVGERHDKFDLVHLVHWLIMDRAQTVHDDLSKL